MNQTVVITGGTRGIGRAAARKFAERGARLALLCRDTAVGEAFAEELRAGGTDAVCYGCDVSSYEAVQRTAAAVEQRFGHVDVLVNNAGIARFGLLIDQNEEDWERIMGTNAKGVFHCCRHFLPKMLERKQGKIINISSMWGLTGASCEVLYSASKAAVIGFTKALAKEVAPSGITVNCVAPGVIDTEMNGMLTEADRRALSEEIPLMRIGRPEEAADAIVFLASDAASYITGQVLQVDGGMVI